MIYRPSAPELDPEGIHILACHWSVSDHYRSILNDFSSTR
jgi:hypothetical protein